MTAWTWQYKTHRHETHEVSRRWMKRPRILKSWKKMSKVSKCKELRMRAIALQPSTDVPYHRCQRTPCWYLWDEMLATEKATVLTPWKLEWLMCTVISCLIQCMCLALCMAMYIYRQSQPAFTAEWQIYQILFFLNDLYYLFYILTILAFHRFLLNFHVEIEAECHNISFLQSPVEKKVNSWRKCDYYNFIYQFLWPLSFTVMNVAYINM